jgi:ribonuclease BN (tRNA processing enzyme)
MNLLILGSGTGTPLPNRASPSLALFTGHNLVLFDIGPGTIRQLKRAGVDHDRIDQIFITHFHPDHTADLIHFLFATRDPKVLQSRDPFVITGPEGLEKFLAKLRNVYEKWLDIPGELITIEELNTKGPDRRSYPNYDILSTPVKHAPGSLAYRVHGKKGESFVYSGDTEYCNEIVDLAKGCDLLILECSFPEGKPVEGHLTPLLAGRIATLAGVKRLLLIHFYPEVLATDISSNCRRAYKGELILGRDMLHITV